MITVLANENNPISQDFYDSVINSLQLAIHEPLRQRIVMNY
jgi:hypothetical protein